MTTTGAQLSDINSDTFANADADRAGLSVEDYNKKIASQSLNGFTSGAKNIGPSADITQAGSGVVELIKSESVGRSPALDEHVYQGWRQFQKQAANDVVFEIGGG